MPRGIFNKQVSCPNCGKLAKKHTTTHWERSEGPYVGNMQVVNRRATFDQDILTLWDGESYEMYCGYFCTNRCAQDFGNDAFDAGFRRS